MPPTDLGGFAFAVGGLNGGAEVLFLDGVDEHEAKMPATSKSANRDVIFYSS
jgi:hypothetical protein